VEHNTKGLTYCKTKVLTPKAICVDRIIFILNAQDMYIKSLEDLRSDIQILKDVYFNKFNRVLTDDKIAEAMNSILLQQQNEMLKNKFINYTSNDLITVLEELLKSPVSKPQPDTSIDQPITSNRKGKKNNG